MVDLVFLYIIDEVIEFYKPVFLVALVLFSVLSRLFLFLITCNVLKNDELEGGTVYKT